ncbi:sigma-70 family RNA polymerase sigma factor [Alistipes sp. OttesenSCG-928-B03]|nr:sigma-70 family RNA polymerase sigma factor [Alistipes sp. OttesenSCG-928-B03]
MQDDKIFLSFKSGDLNLLYDQVFPGLLLYAMKYLGPRAEFMAEDCVQDAVFKAWERKDSFESIYSLKSFLYTTIKNNILDIHRKKSAGSRYLKQLDNETSFINSIIAQEVQSLIYNAINELPGKAGEVFRMSYYKEMKNDEIAQALELSVSSIKQYKAKAMEQLRVRLKDSLAMLLAALFC